MDRGRDERRQVLLDKFREVAVERVAAISSGWVQLEEAPDKEVAAELARQIHTLKGEARTLGFEGLSELVHDVEDLFHRAREVGFRLSSAEVGDAFLAGMDEVGKWVLNLAGHRAAAPAVVLQVRSALRVPAAEEATSSSSGPALPAASRSTPRDPPAPAPSFAARPTAGSPAESLRVPLQRLARLSNLATELTTLQSRNEFRVRRTVEALRRLDHLLQASPVTGAPAVGAELASLRSGVRDALRHTLDLVELSHLQGLQTRALETASRDLRLVPVAPSLSHYPRAVRDMAAQLGKQATLFVEAAEMEADKRVLEALDEPLLHQLRNAIDHGVESPADRVARGKRPAGQITLRVLQPAPGTLTLEVEDDGAGVDPEALRRKAVAQGLISPDAASALSDADAAELMFLPGLSTRSEVGALSGRGVGMDVVKRRVEKLGGSVQVSNRPGQGLKTSITVPVSVTLTRVLLLAVGGRTFALPSASLEHILSPARAQDGETNLPLRSLAALLGLEAETSGPLVVLHSGAQRCAVQVSRVFGETDLLLEPVERPLRRNRLLTGAGVLPSGELVLGLDAGELLGRCALEPGPHATSRGPREGADP